MSCYSGYLIFFIFIFLPRASIRTGSHKRPFNIHLSSSLDSLGFNCLPDPPNPGKENTSLVWGHIPFIIIIGSVMGRWPRQSQWDFCWASRKDSHCWTLWLARCGASDASYFSKGESTWECGQTEKESSDEERTKGPQCCWVSTWNCTRGFSVTSAVTVSDICPHTVSSSWAHTKATFLSLPCGVYKTKLQAKEVCAEMIEATFKPFPKNILFVCLVLPPPHPTPRPTLP